MNIKYMLIFALLLTLCSLLFPTPLLANDEHGCAHEPTVQALRDCVAHAAAEGHIDNPGVAKSLLAMLDAAQDALSRGQAGVAINNVQAFIEAVEAQAGKHIAAEHAQHMVAHAREVVAALSQ